MRKSIRNLPSRFQLGLSEMSHVTRRMSHVRSRSWRKRGQVMLIAVLILGTTMLGATAIAGLITTYRVKQSAASKQSGIAIFAADAGLERALYQCFKQSQPFPTCATFTGSLINGGSYSVVYIAGPPQEIRAVGRSSSGVSSRALRFRF